jgi:PAS domain S-box-containing protein
VFFLWTSYTTEELLVQPMRAMLSHSKAEVNPHPWEECPMFATLTTGAVHQHGKGALWRKDGTHIPMEYISTPIHEEAAIVGAVVTLNDITECKRAEEALRLSRERYALAVNAGKVGVWEWRWRCNG